MKVTIQHDQAVWERETFEVEVPDGLAGEDLHNALWDALDEFQDYDGDGYRKEVLNAVESLTTQTVATLPGGEEIKL